MSIQSVKALKVAEDDLQRSPSVLNMGVFALWLMSSVAKVPGSPRGSRARALLM